MSSTSHVLHTHEVEVKSIRLVLVFTGCLWQQNESSKKGFMEIFQCTKSEVVPDHTLVW